MPAFLGPLVAWSLGAALAWLSRSELARDDEATLAARARVVALFAVLVVAPVAAYFLIFAADWSLAYLVDGRLVPSAALLVLVVADAAAVLGGFAAGARAARRRADGVLMALAAVPALLALAAAFALLDRLRVDGSYLQVRGDFGTQPVAGGPLGYAILWMDALLAVGFGITARLLAARHRPAPPPGEGDPPAGAPRGYLGRRGRG